jgi:uncharacterized short protein YbdD (DUF466 family)
MTTRERIERAANVIRRIIGVPDYDRYIEHCSAHHPDAKPMTREEFMRHRVTQKYSTPGGRCC